MRKEINEQNWLDADPAMASYVKVSPAGVLGQAGGQDWLAPILDVQLLSSVPEEVQDLYEGARGALIYGYFYYSLYFLGITELYRVAEAAVAHKCIELNAPPSKRKYGPSFMENIKWLADQGAIKFADWESIPDSRNFASHLKSGGIITPAMAHMVLKGITWKINALFPDQSAS